MGRMGDERGDKMRGGVYCITVGAQKCQNIGKGMQEEDDNKKTTMQRKEGHG